MRFGNKEFIRKAIDQLKIVNDLSADDATWQQSSRELDGMIALSVFGRPASPTSYESSYEDSRFPFAIVMDYQRTMAIHHEVIEFNNPAGPGFVLMNAAKVPRFSTKIDDGLRLLGVFDWTMSSNGLVKCEPMKLRERLRTPALSLCAVGLRIHLSLHD